MAGIEEIVHVPAVRADGFLDRIAGLNRRARRLGARVEVRAEEVGREPRPVQVTSRVFRDGAFAVETRTETRPCVLFRLSAPEPVVSLPGWRFAGWIASRRARKDTVSGAVDAPHHDADPDRPISAETLARAFDGRGRMACEHCGTHRVRRMGFVVRETATGRERVVGSTCLLDHTGHDPKVVLAHFQALPLLRAEIESERRWEGFGAVLTDWAAEAEAEARARAARDAARHTPLRIAGAILKATGLQGFYARTDGDGRRATDGHARDLLAEGYGFPDGVWDRVREILAHARLRHPDLPADEAEITIAEYRRFDPDFRVVADYAAEGRAPLGRTYGPGEPAALWHLRSEAVTAAVPTAYGTKEVDRTLHVFRDDAGSRILWETASSRLDAAIAAGESIRVTFRTKRSFVERARMTSVVADLRLADKAPRAPRAARPRSPRPARTAIADDLTF